MRAVSAGVSTPPGHTVSSPPSPPEAKGFSSQADPGLAPQASSDGVPSSRTPLSSDSRTGVASQARDARSHPPPYRKGASEESGTPKKPDKGADLPHSPQHAHQAPTLPPKAKSGSAGVQLAPSLPPKMQSALMQPAVTLPVQKMIREPRAGGEAQSTYLVGVRSPHEGKAGARGGSDIVSRRLGSEDEADEVESVA